MSRSSHLTQNERLIIEKYLSESAPFRQIACETGKDPRTIAREIRRNSQTERICSWKTTCNACQFRRTCAQCSLCPGCKFRRR